MFLEDDILFILILIVLEICLTLDVGGGFRTNINLCWYCVRLTKWFIRIVIQIECYI